MDCDPNDAAADNEPPANPADLNPDLNPDDVGCCDDGGSGFGGGGGCCCGGCDDGRSEALLELGPPQGGLTPSNNALPLL